ncbi:hypothetical protein [Amycolatopsis echigonensis]|uniref:HTH cro/C1-type domain-containing protein n=1 Tax=Amycolatopsis echigonensis TaxID=2576905 RepID=A0A8E2B8F6_9PSEU|nr:hypothetical protein [Amycolatopsis echigonensis]MBB2502923.1 hypothetical protein [Amycolatopsis echigonensis]
MSEFPERSRGWWIEDRRTQLGMTVQRLAAEAGLSDETIRRAANGNPMRAGNKRKLESALQWAARSIDDIDAGGEPTELTGQPGPMPEPAPESAPRQRVDPAKAVRALLELAADQRTAGNSDAAEEALEMATRLARRTDVLVTLAGEIAEAEKAGRQSS